LLEHPVFVAQPIAHSWELHRCDRIKEASSETAEASIAETGVRLLVQHAHPIEIFFFDELLGDGVEQQILNIIGERSAQKKFY